MLLCFLFCFVLFCFCFSYYNVDDLVRIKLIKLEAAEHFLGQTRHITLCEADATLEGKLDPLYRYSVLEKELNWSFVKFSTIIFDDINVTVIFCEPFHCFHILFLCPNVAEMNGYVETWAPITCLQLNNNFRKMIWVT